MSATKTKIDFVNRNGEVMKFPAKMTLAQLVAAGVTNIRPVKKGTPLPKNSWRNK